MQLIDVQLRATMIVQVFLVGNVSGRPDLSQKGSVNVTGSVTALYPIEQDAAELFKNQNERPKAYETTIFTAWTSALLAPPH